MGLSYQNFLGTSVIKIVMVSQKNLYKNIALVTLDQTVFLIGGTESTQGRDDTLKLNGIHIADVEQADQNTNLRKELACFRLKQPQLTTL